MITKQGTKKNVSKSTKKIIDVNKQIIEFCNSMLSRDDLILDEKEKEGFENIAKHMINLNDSMLKN